MTPIVASYIATEYWPFIPLLLCWYVSALFLIHSKTRFTLSEISSAFNRCLNKPPIGIFGIPMLIFMIVPFAVSYLFTTPSKASLSHAWFWWNVYVVEFFLFSVCHVLVYADGINNLHRVVDFEYEEYTYVFSGGVIGVFYFAQSLGFVDTCFLVASTEKNQACCIYHNFPVAVYCSVAAIFTIPYGRIFALMSLFVHRVTLVYLWILYNGPES